MCGESLKVFNWFEYFDKKRVDVGSRRNEMEEVAWWVILVLSIIGYGCLMIEWCRY